MKKVITTLIFLFSICSLAQNLKPIHIIKQRSYYLNGGARATFAGGKSRETIKIDLPANTKSWYYSFTTTPGADGTELLNLGVQLTATMYGGMAGSQLASTIKVPKGSGSVDVFVLTPKSRDTFLNKDDSNWLFYKDISLQNTTQAVQYVENKYGTSLYLGLRNPSAMTGIGISIEVVAIVEEPAIDADKGILYGNLGWKCYEKGEYEKCIELSNKALTFDPNLAYVKFNIALVHLTQQTNDCIDYYVDAISSCKTDKNPKITLIGALQDIRKLKAEKNYLKNIDEIEEIVSNELGKY